MWPDVESGSVIWELVEHIEPSRVVSVRCADFPNKSGNDIAQIIVRMHTMQVLIVFAYSIIGNAFFKKGKKIISFSCKHLREN